MEILQTESHGKLFFIINDANIKYEDTSDKHTKS